MHFTGLNSPRLGPRDSDPGFLLLLPSGDLLPHNLLGRPPGPRLLFAHLAIVDRRSLDPLDGLLDGVLNQLHLGQRPAKTVLATSAVRPSQLVGGSGASSPLLYALPDGRLEPQRNGPSDGGVNVSGGQRRGGGEGGGGNGGRSWRVRGSAARGGALVASALALVLEALQLLSQIIPLLADLKGLPTSEAGGVSNKLSRPSPPPICGGSSPSPSLPSNHRSLLSRP